MIYITGDTHGDIDFQRLKIYFKNRYVTEQDYLIILGDAGILWSEKECYVEDYSLLGLTVLYIDGNHENFELLEKFPIIEYKGAKCHRLANNVFHILRGEILYLNGLSFFCMGGATSIDKVHRINRVSWWEEENISNTDINNGLENLKKVDFKVDYVLTHCAPSFAVRKMFGYSIDPNTSILEILERQINYQYWYFGHYHENRQYRKFRCFYGDILEIEKTNQTKDIKYNVLYLDEHGKLHNYETGRKVSIKVNDLPEWFYNSRHYYYSLKNVTDVAFVRSWTDNHLDKDAHVYLHYHGKLKHNEYYEPLNEEEWDVSSWRACSKDICLGLEKYSPKLDLEKLKAAINLNYDHYNQRHELLVFSDVNIVVRPFPNIETPHYFDNLNKDKAKYTVYYDGKILSEFIDLEFAIKYAEIFVSKQLNKDSIRRIEGGKDIDFIFAYDTSFNYKRWLFIKKIQYKKDS